MSDLAGSVVVVTGASSGIGAACATVFAGEGARLIIVARREERLRALSMELERLGAEAVLVLPLDVRDADAVAASFASLPATWQAVEVLVNNAGLSRGLDRLHEGSLEDWNEMIDTNVRGLLHVDRAVVPLMTTRGRGTVIHIGSIAGREVYPRGNVYCATKHAVRALSEGLRLDLLGSGVRVSSIDPGLVETEFSQVRFRGDRERAAAVYRGMQPLAARDVADLALFIASRPPHVNVAEVLVLPTDQASATQVYRRSRDSSGE